MARYFAEIDEDDTVLRVLVAEPEHIDSGRLGSPSNWIEGFMDEDGVTNSKKLYPGIGHKYNRDLEIFYCSQPYPSWTLDENHDWQPPIAAPEQVDFARWIWDEDTGSWVT